MHIYLPVGVLREHSKAFVHHQQDGCEAGLTKWGFAKKYLTFQTFKNTPDYLVSHDTLEALRITIHASVKNRNVMFY